MSSKFWPNRIYFYWHSEATIVVVAKTVRGCSALFFIAVDFWTVIPTKNNLDFVKIPHITGLKNINFV